MYGRGRSLECHRVGRTALQGAGFDSSTLLSPHYRGNVIFIPRNVSETMVGKEIGLFLVLERQDQRKTVLTKYRIARVASASDSK